MQNTIQTQDSDYDANKAVLILSGGLDSTTLLYKLLEEGLEVHALSFNYGQKHSKELKYAQKTCEILGVPYKIVDLSILAATDFFSRSSLTSDLEIPEGHYEEESMKTTVVPNRNMIMISLALGYAITIQAKHVYYGAHAGDHAIYPDCRPIFIEKMQEAARVCHYYPVDLHAPFQHYTKGEIVAEGLKLKADYSLTWTCYKGKDVACGKCGSCVERLEAFEDNDVVDPLPYHQQTGGT